MINGYRRWVRYFFLEKINSTSSRFELAASLTCSDHSFLPLFCRYILYSTVNRYINLLSTFSVLVFHFQTQFTSKRWWLYFWGTAEESVDKSVFDNVLGRILSGVNKLVTSWHDTFPFTPSHTTPHTHVQYIRSLSYQMYCFHECLLCIPL